MNTLKYLSDPDLAPIYLPVLVTGLGAALLCGPLSVLVVLKRLSFVGQGVSHAAFGGAGVAAVAGLAAASSGYSLVIGAFCLGAALVIGLLSGAGQRGRRGGSPDTVIGIVLVGSMALGAILVHEARAGGRAGILSPEAILFGSINAVSGFDAGMTWIVGLAMLVVLWAVRRPMLFWAFDEPVAAASGVPVGAMRLLLMGLLGLAIVLTMKLVGVVLATAMLVLPGAAAARVSDSLGRVLALAVACACAGVVGGLVVSFEADWPTGASIVAVLCGVYAATHVPWRVKLRKTGVPDEG